MDGIRVLRRVAGAVLLLLLAGSIVASASYAQSVGDSAWYSVDADGNVTVVLYFFWAETCPHCHEALPFVQDLSTRHSWLRLHSLEVTHNPEYVDQYMQMAAALGQQAGGVPAFLYCGTMSVGYDRAETTGRALEDQLVTCYRALQDAVDEERVALDRIPAGADSALTLPIVGALDPATLSLPALTIAIAGLDAFNPCAFFVLLFLLSLLVHARSRRRMALVGGIFVLVSGLLYFLFMAAWLNVFLLVGELRTVTLLAGSIAVVVALINVKDYIWYGRGFSLSIPDRAKPRLYGRARALLQTGKLPSLIVGTVVLAVAANAYELLCTSGFPMVYTRILTLQTLPATTFYAYVLLYNVVYVIPLAGIVLVFVVKFGARRLSEAEGRLLKLISGLMMLYLSILLLVAPALLDRLPIAAGLLLATLLSAAGIVAFDRYVRRVSHSPAG